MQILVKNARVVSHRIIAEIDDPLKIASVKKYCNKDRNVFDILPFYQKRSTGVKSQNNHIWGHCKQIASETGWDYRQIEYEARCRAMNDGMRQKVHKETGEPIYDINRHPVPIDSKDMTMKEASKVLEFIHLMAAEAMITLIEGDEYPVDKNE